MTLPLLTVDDPTIQFNFDRLAEVVQGPGIPRVVSGGASNIAASESTTSTSYTTLTTPDTVTVALPTDGLLLVWYQALWRNTIASNARAAIFIGANQAKIAANSGTAAPVVQEATGNATINQDSVLSTNQDGGLTSSNNTVSSTEVTTGQIMGRSQAITGVPLSIFAAAGTYDVSVKFKNTAAGTLTASKRHLWVAAYAFN